MKDHFVDNRSLKDGILGLLSFVVVVIVLSCWEAKNKVVKLFQ